MARSCVLLALAALTSTVSAAEVDFAAARDEAVGHLRSLIRIDTSNPPGNETRAAEYLRDVLAREGIDSVIVGADPARGNLVARIAGSGKKRPILLMGHTDVVGVERDKWTVDPFAGELRDGYVYGRGASDDKDAVAAGLLTLLLLHRQKLPLDRDVIFLAEASEEGGANDFGIGWLVANHWEKIDAEFALAEGGGTTIREGKVALVGIATTEKVPSGMVLTARGTSGHGSIPRPDNPVVRLARAIAKIGDYRPPMRLNETTRTFFERLATISPPHDADLYRRLLDPATADAAQDELLAHSLTYHSMVRTSISPNVIQGGFRYNVIPAEATATLDVRALPDEDVEAFADRLRELIDDPAVELAMRSGGGGRPKAPPSGLDTEMFRALENAQKRLFPDATTVPMLLPAATDMAQVRAKGVQAYGLAAPELEGQVRAHGNDERISVEAMGQYVEFMYRAVVEVAAAR